MFSARQKTKNAQFELDPISERYRVRLFRLSIIETNSSSLDLSSLGDQLVVLAFVSGRNLCSTAFVHSDHSLVDLSSRHGDDLEGRTTILSIRRIDRREIGGIFIQLFLGHVRRHSSIRLGNPSSVQREFCLSLW